MFSLDFIMHVACTYKIHCTKFGGHGLFGFRDFAPFHFPSNSCLDHGLCSPWDQKIESAQKIYASRS